MKTKRQISLFLCGVICLLMPLFLSHTVSAQTTSCVVNDPRDLSYHIRKQINDRVEGVSAAQGLPLFTARPTAMGASWTPNEDAWTKNGTPLDFTGVMGWHGDGTVTNYNPYHGGVTLITPRHYIGASHQNVGTGENVHFFTSNGTPVTRQIVNSVRVGTTDIQIGILNEDVPSSIAHYPIIPLDELRRLTQKISVSNPYDLPILAFNQHRETLILQLFSYGIDKMFHRHYGFYTKSPLGVFSKVLIEGDSGHPAFVIIDDTPVLLFTHYFSTGADTLGDRISEVNNAIVSLGNDGGYRVTEYMPSGFTQPPATCIAPLENKFPGGEAPVITTAPTPTCQYSYDNCLNQYGTIPTGTRGVVADGPEYINGEGWWLIDFDTEVDIDGWANEATLISYVAPVADTTAPTVPSGLSATAVSVSQINVSWNASTDVVGVVGYKVYRCTGASCTPSTLVGTVTTGTTYQDTGLTEDTTYRYAVTAYDAIPNTSTQSGATSATTPSVVVQTYLLSVTKAGSGTGTVSGGSISCGSTCSYAANSDAIITLLATPTIGSSFAGWSSGCSSTNSTTCTVTMTAAKTITATFNLDPVNGMCGLAAKNYTASESFPQGTYCLSGTLSPAQPSNPNSSSQSSWTCVGANSGNTATCTATRSIQPINGLCSTSLNSCTSGTFTDSTDTATQYAWSCTGSNGGTSVSCSFPKQITTIVNGVCSSNLNSCTSGSFSDITDSETEYVWRCAGSNNGTNASCRLPKLTVAPSALPDVSLTTYVPVQFVPTYSQVQVTPVYTPVTTVKNTTASQILPRRIARNMGLGDTGEDVRLLQKTLNVLGFPVAEAGAGSMGNETTSFDINTENALRAYQLQRESSGVSVSGKLDNITQVLINNDIISLREGIATEIDEDGETEVVEEKSFIEKIMDVIVGSILGIIDSLNPF